MEANTQCLEVDGCVSSTRRYEFYRELLVLSNRARLPYYLLDMISRAASTPLASYLPPPLSVPRVLAFFEAWFG